MFEAVFDILSAWNALLYLLAGAGVAGIGVLILAYSLYVRFSERVYQAQIVGVRTNAPGEKMYWPLIAYTDESGKRHEVTANGGSSLLGSAKPGTKVEIYAGAGDPTSVMLRRDWWVLVTVGLILLGAGSPFIAVGASTLHWTRATALVILSLAAYGAWKLYGFWPTFAEARKNGWAATRKAFLERRKDNQHTVIVTDAEIGAITAREAKQQVWAKPIVLAVGVALLIGGGFWLQSTRDFMAKALSADGTVLRNEESDSSDDSPSYHAVIDFTDQSGRTITYTDSVGSSPPMYSTGDKVTVLYDPLDSASAMIDRGIWNWLVPLLIAALGALLAGASAWSYLKRSRSSLSPGNADVTSALSDRQRAQTH